MSSLEHNALLQHYEKLENSISNHLEPIANELVKPSTCILTPEQRGEILDFHDKLKGAKKLLKMVIKDVKQAEDTFIFDTLLDVLYANGNRAMKDLVTNIKSYCHEEYRKKLPESSNSPGDECDVFINYGRGNETNQFVDDLESSLKGRHLKVFVDRTGISPGDRWSQTIANALHSCKAFVAVLTKKYVKSLYCRCELFQAIHGKKKIFPAVRESGWNQEPSGKSVEDKVGSIQYAFVQDGENHETQLRELIENISSHCQPNHQPPVKPVVNTPPPEDVPVVNTPPPEDVPVVNTPPPKDVPVVNGRPGPANGVADGPERSGAKMTTLADLTKYYKLTNEQLDCIIEDHDMRSLGNLFGPWMFYASVPGLGLNDGEKHTIHVNLELTTNTMKMEAAFKVWKGHVILKATFRNLLDIVLKLNQGNVGMNICGYLRNRPPPPPMNVTIPPPGTPSTPVPAAAGTGDKVYTEKEFESLPRDNVLELVDNDTILDGDDLAEILDSLEKESANWQQICTKLHVSSNTIQSLATSDKTNEVRLSVALTEWLKLNYNFQGHGKPTWKKIALSVTMNTKLFLDIARQHLKKANPPPPVKPVVNPPPPVDVTVANPPPPVEPVVHPPPPVDVTVANPPPLVEHVVNPPPPVDVPMVRGSYPANDGVDYLTIQTWFVKRANRSHFVNFMFACGVTIVVLIFAILINSSGFKSDTFTPLQDRIDSRVISASATESPTHSEPVKIPRPKIPFLEDTLTPLQDRINSRVISTSATESHTRSEPVKTPRPRVRDGTLIKPGDTPKMTELRRLKLQNGDSIDLVVMIGTSYPEFGVHILRDKNHVDIIEQGCYYKPKCIVTEILGDWLKGKGRHPVIWTTFVECLRESKLEEVAMDVERQFIS